MREVEEAKEGGEEEEGEEVEEVKAEVEREGMREGVSSSTMVALLGLGRAALPADAAACAWRRFIC